MRVILIALTALLLSGCAPSVQEQVNQEQTAMEPIVLT